MILSLVRVVSFVHDDVKGVFFVCVGKSGRCAVCSICSIIIEFLDLCLCLYWFVDGENFRCVVLRGIVVVCIIMYLYIHPFLIFFLLLLFLD